MLLASLVLLPFLGSVLAALMPQDARNRESWLAIGVAVGGLAIAAALFPQVAAGEVVRAEFAWLPAEGLDFVLRVDGLAWVFSMLVLAIGLLVVLYARYYMSPEDPVPRFFAFLLAFMGSMLGVVLSGNLVQLVVFWELTSL
ncbi:MAG TPA: monovalent cation/H+ antiporter subunit A, partial [Thauera aminoaromatica]|nr:monovalent cation/H+ antiporter subunit A [Thauera aminoaromatica]